MLIGQDWQIESDSLNVILSKKIKRQNKDTKEFYDAWKVVGYFATVAGALHELVNQKVRDTKLKDLKTIKLEIDDLHNMLEAFLKCPTTITGVGKAQISSK